METFKDQYNRYNTNAEKYKLREKLFGTNDVIPMWVADMDIPTPPFILDDIKRRLAHPILGYEEFPNSAKSAFTKWILRNHGVSVLNDEIVYTHSVVTSINIAINAYTKKGDEVIVQPPVYPPFFSSITNNDRKIIINNLIKDDTGNYGFDLKKLKKSITPKTKLLLLCSPHNPVGRVWSKDELKELTKICLKNNILIFSDEIHSDLVYHHQKHNPTLSINDKVKDITITAYGPGKTFNLAGTATSVVVIGNNNLRKKFINTAKKFHLAEGNIFGHIAFESAYQNGQEWRDNILEHFLTNIEKLRNILKPYNDLITFKDPEGTYLVWLDCSGMGLSNKELKKFFIKDAKLGLSTGIAFGRNGSKYMRINIAVPTKTMNEALKRLDRALEFFVKYKKRED